MPSRPSLPTPVVIGGAGPVGLTLSALLSRYGVGNVVLEKKRELPKHPQAHFINCRSMEIFRHAFPPTLAKNLWAVIPPQRYWRQFAYSTAILDGVEIGRVDHFTWRVDHFTSSSSLSPHQVLQQQSPASVAHLSQSRLMPLLYEQAEAAGAAAGTVAASGGPKLKQINFGWEVESFQETSDAIRIKVKESSSGQSQILEAEYLIAADGASSRLRQMAKIDMVGPSGLQHLMNVHFSSQDLARATEGKPAMLYFIYNKDVICVFVAHHFESGEFVAQLPFFPPLQSPQDFDDATVRKLLDAAIGRSFSDLQLDSILPWTMDCQVAQRYRSSSPSGGNGEGAGGRLFLVGDAAHRFPPAGGFGMNTGIQDAHNLAWKLALAIRGNNEKELLLESYEKERKPVAQHNADLSLHNFERSLRVPAALGLDAEQAKAMANLASSSSVLPVLPKPLFETLLSLGRRPLKALEEPGQPYGTSCLAKARQVLQDGAGLPLLFPHEDLGFCHSGLNDREEGDLGKAEGERSAAAAGLAEIVVGRRMPHIWLEYLDKVTGEPLGKISTTDLPDQVHVALEVHEPSEISSAAAAAASVPLLPFAILLTSSEGSLADNSHSLLRRWKEQMSMPLLHVKILPPSSTTPTTTAANSSRRETTMLTFSQDEREELRRCLSSSSSSSGFDARVALRVRDVEGRWSQRSSVLLRPDGHVWELYHEQTSK